MIAMFSLSLNDTLMKCHCSVPLQVAQIARPGIVSSGLINKITK